MSEIRGANQAVEADIFLLPEVMKHQGPAAQTMGPDFKRGPVRGKRIESASPLLPSVLRNRVLEVVVTIVKDQFETPVDGQGNGLADSILFPRTGPRLK